MEIEKRVERIIAVKNQQGLTNQQLADMAGVAASTIYRVLGGKTNPDSTTLQLMETALGISDTPPLEPVMLGAKDDNVLKQICATHETRVGQLRCFYNRALAEKDREIDFVKSELKTKKRVIYVLFSLLTIETFFVIAAIYFDAVHPDIGWIREQLGLYIGKFFNFA